MQSAQRSPWRSPWRNPCRRVWPGGPGGGRRRSSGPQPRKVGLIFGSAAAATRAVALAERDRAGSTGRALARAFGPLAGWLCVAGFANVETTLNLRRGRPQDDEAVRRAVLLIAAASTVGSVAAVAVRGNPLFALAACWGLGGVAVKARRRRQTPVVITAGFGGLVLAASSAGARLTTGG